MCFHNPSTPSRSASPTRSPAPAASSGPINQAGVITDFRGRKISIVATNLPGKYPVLGVQVTKKGNEVSKDGLRLYTAAGKFYENGGSTRDPMDLNLSTYEKMDESELHPTPVRVVDLVYKSGDIVLARKSGVTEGSDLYETLIDDNWEIA